MLNILTKDKKTIEIPKPIAMQSMTIYHILSDLGDESLDTIPIPEVDGRIFGKVVEFCGKWIELQGEGAEEWKEQDENERRKLFWDWRASVGAEFYKEFFEVDNETLFEIILAANFLDCAPLLDCSCQAVADKIKGKTPEEIRESFDIKNDFTPEEEAQIRKENEWCMDL